jgi:outer membrane protein OmpA-like peptidoglycan-associated protein
VSFGPGQAQLKAGTGTDIEQVVTLLGEYPKVLLIVDGYTDNRGSEQLNDRLSLERAKSVQQALVADGLNATRIRTRGLASTDPIADNGTREVATRIVASSWCFLIPLAPSRRRPIRLQRGDWEGPAIEILVREGSELTPMPVRNVATSASAQQ